LRAAQLLERIQRIVHLLIEQIPVLETMFSIDFAKFRDSLRPASGFQSVQFRKLEFLCGNKNPKMLQLVGEDEAARAEMATYLDKPTPYDHFMRHLSREDDDVFQVPRDFLGRDTTQPHEPNAACIASLARLYQKQDEHPKGERYYAQFRVAEHLLEFDERFSIWRFHHVKMVERMIGAGMGTGGSSGAKYLASTLARNFFPDLWHVRDGLGAAPGAGYGGGCPVGGHG
ncbi:MAG TPA: tryptophan 2,3-dioxygenase family protein, partial [Polyangiaceae bacterium]|nr:tryptophan 2,3-dioxygenase family protein [Polyangiaceae bacterium]